MLSFKKFKLCIITHVFFQLQVDLNLEEKKTMSSDPQKTIHTDF
jgi:hypothetical protein